MNAPNRPAPAGYAAGVVTLDRDEFTLSVIADGGEQIVDRERVVVSYSINGGVETCYGTLRAGGPQRVRFQAARGQSLAGSRVWMLIDRLYNNYYQHGFIAISLRRKVSEELRSNQINHRIAMLQMDE